MADKKQENCISPAAADALIAAHDGDTALLAAFCEKYLLSVAETSFPTLKYYRSLTNL